MQLVSCPLHTRRHLPAQEVALEAQKEGEKTFGALKAQFAGDAASQQVGYSRLHVCLRPPDGAPCRAQRVASVGGGGGGLGRGQPP